MVGYQYHRVHVVAGAAYHGKARLRLPRNVTFITRLAANVTLYAPGPSRAPDVAGTTGMTRSSRADVGPGSFTVRPPVKGGPWGQVQSKII